MLFGQAVVGAPGAGKSTYCKAMKEYLERQGRNVAVINLDPANDTLPYECHANVCDLVSVDDVMERLSLGPNGALLYCMHYLVDHMEWLKNAIDTTICHDHPHPYILLDFPGQVELYTHDDAVKTLLEVMVNKWGHRIVTSHLSDAHHCADAAKFVSLLMNALHAMVQLETPHINILSKIDIVESSGSLAFNLEYFTDVLDLRHLVEKMGNDPFIHKHKALASAICGVVEDYSLVNFYPLNVQDEKLMMVVVNAADVANGYCLRQVDNERVKNSLMHDDNSRLDAVHYANDTYTK